MYDTLIAFHTLKLTGILKIKYVFAFPEYHALIF